MKTMYSSWARAAALAGGAALLAPAGAQAQASGPCTLAGTADLTQVAGLPAQDLHARVFAWMVLGSFKGEGELRRVPPTWWPEAASLDNYTLLFTKLDFATYFANSVIVAVVVTAGNLLFCSMLGYALAMLDFPGKKALLLLVLATLMIPGVVTFVPLFVLVANAAQGSGRRSVTPTSRATQS